MNQIENNLVKKERKSAYAKAYRKANKEKVQQQDRDSYARNREKNLARAKEYRRNNKEILAKRDKERREKNKEKISLRTKAYYRNNREVIRERAKVSRNKKRKLKLIEHEKYLEENKEEIERQRQIKAEDRRIAGNKRCKEYYHKNKERLSEHLKECGKKYYINNRDKVRAAHKETYLKCKDRILIKQKKLNSSPTSNELFINKLPKTDKAKLINGFITVLCKKCTIRFAPTSYQIKSRIASFEGKKLGESNLYCSDLCKENCELYKFRACIQTDPRSKLYIDNTITEMARKCQNNALKQVQCDQQSGQSHCEKCGDFIDVELHHTLLISKHGQKSINSAGHILLCAGCHVSLHGECNEVSA